jgi:hypothetical protein
MCIVLMSATKWGKQPRTSLFASIAISYDPTQGLMKVAARARRSEVVA